MPSIWNKINAFYMPTDLKHIDVTVRPQTKKIMSRLHALIDWTSYSWPSEYREMSIDNSKDRICRIEKKRPYEQLSNYAPTPLHLIIKALVLGVLSPLTAPILTIPRLLTLMSAKQRAKINFLAHHFAFRNLEKKYSELSNKNIYAIYENTFTRGFRLDPQVAQEMPKQTLKFDRDGINEWVSQVRAYKDSTTDKGIAFSENVKEQLEAIAKNAEGKIELIEKAKQKHDEKVKKIEEKKEAADQKRKKAAVHFANLWAPKKPVNLRV